MKLVIILIAISALAAICQAQVLGNPLYTGQPGCQTEEELSVVLYPHFRNKRAYWRCSVLGQPATFELCPIGEGFLAAENACVPWLNWYWTPTVAPPSSPALSGSVAATEESAQ